MTNLELPEKPYYKNEYLKNKLEIIEDKCNYSLGLILHNLYKSGVTTNDFIHKSLLHRDSLIVSGSFIPSILNEDRYGDIDFFTIDYELYSYFDLIYNSLNDPILTVFSHVFDEFFECNSKYVYRGFNVLNVKNTFPKVSIVIQNKVDALEVVKEFDFVHLMGYYDFTSRGVKMTSGTYNAIREKKLIPNKGPIKLSRQRKYIDRGYK